MVKHRVIDVPSGDDATASRDLVETVDLLITSLAVIQLLVSAHLRGDLCEDDFLSDFGDILPEPPSPDILMLPQPIQREALEAVARMREFPRQAVRLASTIALGREVPSLEVREILRDLLELQEDLEDMRSRLAAM